MPVWITAAALAGCQWDEGPLGIEQNELPASEAGGLQALLSCQVDLRSAALGCAAPEAAVPSGISAVMVNLGGQGTYVLLESSNVEYDAGSGTFSAEVAIRNLLSQALGTADGATPAADGIRVFFLEEPTNGVTVKAPHGVDLFTSAGQPYYRYDQVLVPGRRSLAQTWEWSVPEGVTDFQFRVAISAEVPDGAYEASGRPLTLDPQTITLGGFHSCGLTLAGTAYCWGSNEFGQLGSGGIGATGGPSAITGHTFTEITAGYKHTCALEADGTAYCWGLAADGQLGNGESGLFDPNEPTSYRYQTTPVRVATGLKFLTISGGGLNTCGITATGAAYCWGRGREGQLGNGTSGTDPEDPASYVYATKPTLVGGSDYVAISVGGSHSCALTGAGAIYCWGVNEWGQLGNGAGGGGTVADLPQLVVAGGQQFTAISAGLTHTCALARGGKAYCWGERSAGRLGDGAGAGEARFIATPQEVMGGRTFASISAGAIHSCALSARGEAFCWGRNTAGQLGIGAPSDSVLAPAQVLAGAGVGPFSAVGAWGDNQHGHTCALSTAGQLYCWGHNGQGQLGQPAGGDVNATPMLVAIP